MSHYSIYHIDTAIIKHEGYFPGGGCTAHILGTGMCYWEGYLFSRCWYKERYQFSQFGVRNGNDLQDFAMKYEVGYTSSKSLHKFGYTFSKNWYKGWVCF